MKEICSLNDAAHFQVERLILHVLLPIKCEHGLCTADNFAIVCSIFPNLIKVYLILLLFFCFVLSYFILIGWFRLIWCGSIDADVWAIHTYFKSHYIFRTVLFLLIFIAFSVESLMACRFTSDFYYCERSSFGFFFKYDAQIQFYLVSSAFDVFALFTLNAIFSCPDYSHVGASRILCVTINR